MRLSAPFSAKVLPVWLLVLAAGCRTGTAKGPADELLATGRTQFEAKEYRDSIRQFRGVKAYHEESDEAEEALFLQAESARHIPRPQESFTAYKDLAERYPNSRFAVGAAVGEYKLGMDHLEGRMPGFLFFGAERSQGVKVLEHMQIHYRNHSLADDALMEIADFQIGRGDFDEAVFTLRRLLSVYPRSEHALRARYQLARSLWHQNQGPRYDERLLTDSRRAFEDFIGTVKLDGLEEHYGEQIAAAGKMIATIDERMAENKHEIGRFYERTRRYGAAVYYYRICLRDYPQTEGAKKCAARIERLTGKKAG